MSRKHKRDESESESEKKQKVDVAKRVLLLGCGLVAPPLIHYLTNHGIHVTIASRTVSKTLEVVKDIDKKLVTAVAFDVEKPGYEGQLNELTADSDLVISLLPYLFHVPAAQIALKHKKHFCTTSYTSDAMAALDSQGKAANVILLNECGVDPGLDHMSAQKVIDHVHSKGGKVIGFTSLCGGLPAPQDNNNPFGYKLSWSPRGVLLASRNDAVYFENGEIVRVEGKNLFDSSVYKVEPVDGQTLEWYPNRDSTKYAEIYSIPEVKTLIRGTYRNLGWCRTLSVIANFGFISTDIVNIAGQSYLHFTINHLGGNVDEVKDPKAFLASKFDIKVDDPIIHKFEWIGLLDPKLQVPQGTTTALDALCYLFQRSLVYAPGEKDMLVMRHTFEVEYSRSHRETLTSTMLDFGLQPEGFSSMSRTVSLPVAAAVRGVLDGTLKSRGIVRPIEPEVYNLILDEMNQLNIKFEEKRLGPHLWLRSETKPGEERVAITPSDVKKLIDSGFRISVEKSPHRCFPDSDYKAVGATLVETGSWIRAPSTAIIVGLKELPESKDPLRHRHIYFAHCYKDQSGWKEILNRFKQGGGLLWDLEFLNDDEGRRVAAFGRAAGVVGMALAIYQWALQRTPHAQPLKNLKSWKSTQAMVDTVKDALAKATEKKQAPRALVLGALGRCGRGAVWFAEQVGIEVTKWDLPETKSGGPFAQLLTHDILVNAIYLREKIPPFLTLDFIHSFTNRQLSVFSDVSCDYTNPNNPFPIYSQGTTLVDPIISLDRKTEVSLPLDIISIDHLPSLTPIDSSREFSTDLLPHLQLLHTQGGHVAPVWTRAEKLFYDKLDAAAIKPNL